MREKLKNAKTEDGSFTKLTEKYASEKELVAKMNEDFDKVFEETYKYMARKLKMLVQTPTTETKIEGGAQQPIPNVAELPNKENIDGGDL